MRNVYLMIAIIKELLQQYCQPPEFPNLGFFKATLPDSRLLKSPNPVSRS